MEILPSFTPPKELPHPLTLTIGNFDGVHLGHQKILAKLREQAGEKGCVSVITFPNHPSHVLPKSPPVPLILNPAKKLALLEKYGVDLVYLLEFTLDLAQLPYDEFIKKVRAVYPFDLLILGKGATLGKKREGTPEKLTALSEKLGFRLEYLTKAEIDGETISSGKIRAYLEEGNLTKAHTFLGH